MSRLDDFIHDIDMPWNSPPFILFLEKANKLVKSIRISVRAIKLTKSKDEGVVRFSMCRVASLYIDRVQEMNRLFMDNHDSRIRGMYASKGKQEDSLSWRRESWWRNESDPFLSRIGRFSQTRWEAGSVRSREPSWLTE